MKTTGNFFDSLGDGNPPEVMNSAGPKSAGPGALIGLVGMTALFVFAAPSCSPGAALSVTVPGRGSLEYSAKGGLAVDWRGQPPEGPDYLHPVTPQK